MATEKQRLYAQARLRGEKPEQAAISAGFSAHSARAKSFQLEKHPKVVAMMAFMRGEKVPEVPQAPSAKKSAPAVNIEIPNTEDPEAFLINVMNNEKLDMKIRMDAAKTLMPYKKMRLGEGGKKDKVLEDAKKAVGGQYAPAPAPGVNRTAH